MVRITYYLDVVSSWCFYFEPTWTRLIERFGEDLETTWEVSLIPSDALPKSAEEERIYYRRSGIITRQQKMLNADWVDPEVNEYLAPNLVALACRELGYTGDSVRLAIAQAAMIDGLRVADWEVSAQVAASTSGFDAQEIIKKARSPEIEQHARQTTEDFSNFGINQRPAFFIESEIEDRAVLSGLIHYQPLEATIQAMIDDVRAYRSWDAHTE